MLNFFCGMKLYDSDMIHACFMHESREKRKTLKVSRTLNINARQQGHIKRQLKANWKRDNFQAKSTMIMMTQRPVLSISSYFDRSEHSLRTNEVLCLRMQLVLEIHDFTYDYTQKNKNVAVSRV